MTKSIVQEDIKGMEKWTIEKKRKKEKRKSWLEDKEKKKNEKKQK
jgi:hypothetical protein